MADEWCWVFVRVVGVLLVKEPSPGVISKRGGECGTEEERSEEDDDREEDEELVRFFSFLGRRSWSLLSSPIELLAES